jgi:hypothetical protein
VKVESRVDVMVDMMVALWVDVRVVYLGQNVAEMKVV